MSGSTPAQSLAVKRAEVEFHNFASIGDPERVLEHYARQNINRGALIRRHLDFIGPLTPFLEVGANAGHTSYLLANEFGANGFALDLSADALRHGAALQDIWNYPIAPVRIAGDALKLPVADESIQFVMTFQTLSQFMDIESVFLEVKRVLKPGGVFMLCEEPLRRTLSLRLYRCPYYPQMKPWERKLFDWGLLGYLVQDVIGAEQEESFGIRQNHTMTLLHWRALIEKHFPSHELELFTPQRGWGETILSKLFNQWQLARLLGGTLAAMCRKAGSAKRTDWVRFESLLRCPDCSGSFELDADETLRCRACGYAATNDGGVYNLLASKEKTELYPGDRPDIIDFSRPGHEQSLLGDWYELEGVYGNRWRWIGPKAEAQLRRVDPGPQRLRIRGWAVEGHENVELRVSVNGSEVGRWTRTRPGLFILEADLTEADEYHVSVEASPTWMAPPDDRVFSVNLSMIRLVPASPEA